MISSNKNESIGIEVTDFNTGRITLEMIPDCPLQPALNQPSPPPLRLGDWPPSLCWEAVIILLIPDPLPLTWRYAGQHPCGQAAQGENTCDVSVVQDSNAIYGQSSMSFSLYPHFQSSGKGVCSLGGAQECN